MKVTKVLTASLLALSLVALSGCGKEQAPVGGATGDVVTRPFTEVTKINGQVFGTFYYVTVPFDL